MSEWTIDDTKSAIARTHGKKEMTASNDKEEGGEGERMKGMRERYISNM